MRITAGIDVGSTYTKAVLVDRSGDVLATAMEPTGFRLAEVAAQALENALALARLERKDVAYVVATGFGRHQVAFADVHITDLTAAARGVAWSRLCGTANASGATAGLRRRLLGLRRPSEE